MSASGALSGLSGVWSLKGEGRQCALHLPVPQASCLIWCLRSLWSRDVQIAPDCKREKAFQAPSVLWTPCGSSQCGPWSPAVCELSPTCNEIGTEREQKHLEMCAPGGGSFIEVLAVTGGQGGLGRTTPSPEPESINKDSAGFILSKLSRGSVSFVNE